MLRLALACLLLAPPQDIPTFDGSAAPPSTTRTTLEQLLEAPGDYTVESTTVLERVRVEDIRRVDDGERVAGAWALAVREPATGARTAASLSERRLVVAVLAESIARTVAERRDLRTLDARLRVSVFADDAGDGRTLYLAVVSSIEWFDRQGRLVASAW